MWSPLENAANAFLAFALLTLGAQVAYPALKNFTFIFYLSVLGRLVFSPILALSILLILGMDGTIAQALFIASSFPMSRNSALFALIYDNYPDYAGQGVLVSTLFSSITVTIVVYLAEVIF
ncbi:AEC family transporter [Alteribacillus sp. YIM 98480]|uniref:AEC family transporter n=1 Tax=Alteribacillus sp. YIM 98480 TaxID=2606599 RepID=UPI00351B6088